jgi:hypothetical protein
MMIINMTIGDLLRPGGMWTRPQPSLNHRAVTSVDATSQSDVRYAFDQDWSADQKRLLQAYAERHEVHLELDLTDGGRPPSAGFSVQPNCYPSFTLIRAAATFVLTDHCGYTVFESLASTDVLDVLALQLQQPE